MKTNNTKNRTKNPDEFFLLKTSLHKNSLINTQYLQELTNGNVSFINAVLQAFRDEARAFLIEMGHGLTLHDFLSVKKTAHKIKPSGAYIGADALTLLVGDLEQAAERANAEEVKSLLKSIKGLLKAIFAEIDWNLKKAPLRV